MVATSPAFERALALAQQLSDDERQRLINRLLPTLPAGEPVAAGSDRTDIAGLISAMQAPPHISRDDVDELERAIREGRQPVQYEGTFDLPGR